MLPKEDERWDFDAPAIRMGVAGLRQWQVWMLIEADGARELLRQLVGILYQMTGQLGHLCFEHGAHIQQKRPQHGGLFVE